MSIDLIGKKIACFYSPIRFTLVSITRVEKEKSLLFFSSDNCNGMFDGFDLKTMNHRYDDSFRFVK